MHLIAQFGKKKRMNKKALRGALVLASEFLNPEFPKASLTGV